MLTDGIPNPVPPPRESGGFPLGIRELWQRWRLHLIGDTYQPTAQIDASASCRSAMQHKSVAAFLPNPRQASKVFAWGAIVTMAAFQQSWAEALPMKAVAPGVFVYEGETAAMTRENHGGIANVGFIVGSSAVAVIDTGGSPEVGRRLREAVKSLTDLPIRWVVNTHMHPDHVFGNAAFVGPDVAFVGHARLNAALEARFDHYVTANTRSMGPDALVGVVRVPATRSVENRLEIDLGGRTIEVVAWPTAHTDNDVTVYDRETRTLFAGDLVFLHHLPSIDGSLRGWQRALEELAAIPAERVVPGHGPAPSPWPEAIEPERRYFEVLAGDLKRAIDDGIPLSEAVKTAGGAESGRWALFEAFNTRNATAAYAELEWE